VVHPKEASLWIAGAAVDGNSWQKKLENCKQHWKSVFHRGPQIYHRFLSIYKAGTQNDSELFPRLSKDTLVKIKLCLIKSLSPSENEPNSAFEDPHGREKQCSANYLKKNIPDSNEIQSLKDKLELAINERLSTVLLRNFKA